MRRIITGIIVLSLLSSCIPRSDYDKLKLENEDLKSSNKRLENSVQQLTKELELIDIENEKIESKKRETSFHTEEEALKIIEDYYKFYYANKIYRNPQLRRIDNNKFRISLEECSNKADFKENDFFWNSRVLTIEIDNNGTYKVY